MEPFYIMPSPGDIAYLEGKPILIQNVGDCSVSWCDPILPALCGITTRGDFEIRFQCDPRNAIWELPAVEPEEQEEL